MRIILNLCPMRTGVVQVVSTVWAGLCLLSGPMVRAQCGSVNSANGLVINLADPSGCNCSSYYDFYDDGGAAGNYSNSRDDTVRFVSPGRRLRIQFISSSLESGYDPLWIYDGNVTPGTTPRAGLMWRLNGTSYPSLLFSTQDTVTFIFHSDGSVTSSGWHARIDCVPVGGGGTVTRYDLGEGSTSHTISCNSPVSFYDGGGPAGLYPEAVDDTVTFTPSTPNDYLMAAFPYQLSLNTGDTLWVYENTISPNNLLAIFSPGSSRAETLLTTAPGNSLIFRFKSDYDGMVGGGWGALISCAPNPRPPSTTYMGAGLRTVSCGGSLYRFYDSGSPGLVLDNDRSGYGNYANSENRVITFVSQNQAERLRLDISSFSTESAYDWLEVYDGPTTSSPLIGRWSGTTIPSPILSTGPFLTIRFTSDVTTNYSGWVGSVQCSGLPAPPAYTMSSNTQTVTTCSALFYDEGGPSGNYTTFPQDRVFTFCPDDPTQYLRVRFPYQFRLAAGDTMWVYEGPNVDPTRLVGIYVRGNRGEEIAAQTPNTCLTFRFKAGATSVGAPGWHGIVECTPNQRPSVTWMQGAGLRRSCNLLLYDDGGLSNYRNAAEDTLLLVSPTGCGVSIQFTLFNTEANYDILQLYNGGTFGAPLIGSYSGSSLPNSGSPITPGGDSLLIRFTSDGTNTSSGWSAIVSCANGFTVSVSPSGNMSICRGSSVTLTASGGPASTTYTWNTGSTGSTLTVTAPGTYYVTAQAPSGCTAISAPVTVDYYPAADTTVTLVSNTLSNATCNDPAYSCAWYDCSNNQQVGTGSSYTPSTSGWYKLIITHTSTGCRDTSNCHYVGTSAFLFPGGKNLLSLYPNPTSGTSTIEANRQIERVEVWDMQGRRVHDTGVGNFTYELPALPQGHYKVIVQMGDGEVVLLSWEVMK